MSPTTIMVALDERQLVALRNFRGYISPPIVDLITDMTKALPRLPNLRDVVTTSSGKRGVLVAVVRGEAFVDWFDANAGCCLLASLRVADSTVTAHRERSF